MKTAAQQPRAISVDDIASQLFCKLYLDNSGRTPEHIAARAYEAAEAFVEYSKTRK